MPIVHVVLFEFKPNTTYADVKGACDRMLALSTQCERPASRGGGAYIKTSVGGRDESPEGHQGGFTHGFVVEFESREDVAYYLEEDPAHAAFKRSVAALLQNVRVVDFEPGVY